MTLPHMPPSRDEPLRTLIDEQSELLDGFASIVATLVTAHAELLILVSDIAQAQLEPPGESPRLLAEAGQACNQAERLIRVAEQVRARSLQLAAEPDHCADGAAPLRVARA
jgi:hypothetical protein